MNWLLIGCGALMAWVALCVVSGERQRRRQQQEIDQRAAPGAATPSETPPGKSARPVDPVRRAA